MRVAQSQPYVPLESFLEMEPEPGMRLEWCAGLVYAMSGGSPEHARLCARVHRTLLPLVGPDCTAFDSQADLWLGEAITNEVVIVEVLSPSTEARDRGEKFEAYKQLPSLKEYVLVSQSERRIEVLFWCAWAVAFVGWLL